MKKPVIICVDDEQTILSSLKSELNRTLEHGFFIEVADSGEDGLEVCEELLEEGSEIPVVISDYIMPGMKGDEFLGRIHEISPHTLTIMLTGQASLEGVTNAVNQAKLYRYIAKPWQAEDLRLTVKEALRSYFQTKQLEELTREQAALIEKLRENETRLTHFTRELEILNKAYERFIPKQFLNLLGKKSVVDIHLGQQVEKEMSVMFSDIRGFTSLSEDMTPQENFNFINAYLRRMEPIIAEHAGFVDKYIGDAIMALFPRRADDALRAAIEMYQSLQVYNRERQETGYRPFQIGIGINTGNLMLGTVGGPEHIEGTVIADAVNLSARVEELTKTYGIVLLITEHTYQALTDPGVYDTRMIDHVTVKGKSRPVTVYEVFDGDSDKQRTLKSATLNMFEQGLQTFHAGGFEQARGYFEQVLAQNPEDSVARIYLDHCHKVLSMQLPKKSKILVVDDTPVNTTLLSRLLEKHGYHPIVAENGEIALDMAAKEAPHLILLDIMMPGLDGFETCAALKENDKTREIPVVFMTTLTELESKVKGFELGAVDYITKPFQAQEVLARIRTHLTNAHLQKQLQLRNVELEINNLALKEEINQVARNPEI